jgi:hypothetical protein
MDETSATVRFLGDLEDPWVRALVESLRTVGDVHAVMCAGEIPERLYESGSPPCLVVLHRSRLTSADASRLERWRASASLDADRSRLPRVVLFYGPHVRYAELERCARVVDLVIPEATAVETLLGQLSAIHARPTTDRPGSSGFDAVIEVLSTDHALRAMLSDACASRGYRVSDRALARLEPDRRAHDAPEWACPLVRIWDVPVLEPQWPGQLSELNRAGPVIALLGFADRAAVKLARDHGAAATLDVPFSLDDLFHVLDRIVRSLNAPGAIRVERGHRVPPAPASRASRGRAAIRSREARPAEGPYQDATARISSRERDGLSPRAREEREDRESEKPYD